MRFTAQAEEDFLGIYAFGVEAFGISQAERYHAELETTFLMLADMPSVGREHAEFHPPVRIHFHASHVIVYLANPDGILIVRLLGSRQNWARILAREDG
ncbi:type II toxin-antitoxin system RelE/ParE family toxin [Rhizobium sp. PAMB 3174]